MPSSPIKYWRVVLVPEWGMWETCRDKDIIAIGYPKSPKDVNVQRFRDEMKIGDKVVAYLKRGQIGGIGTITGDYSVDEVVFQAHYWRIRKVQWNHKSFDGFELSLNKATKAILGQRGSTIVELSKDQFEEIERQILSW
jgi:predicted Mrr-cat superfamily restriction endonuclease